MRASSQLFLWSVDAFIRELESSMMDGDAGLGSQDLMGSNRLLGSHVQRRHEPAWFIRSDRQQGEVRRSERFPNLSEMRSERGVSCEIYEPFLTLDHISAP